MAAVISVKIMRVFVKTMWLYAPLGGGVVPLRFAKPFLGGSPPPRGARPA